MFIAVELYDLIREDTIIIREREREKQRARQQFMIKLVLTSNTIHLELGIMKSKRQGERELREGGGNRRTYFCSSTSSRSQIFAGARKAMHAQGLVTTT